MGQFDLTYSDRPVAARKYKYLPHSSLNNELFWKHCKNSQGAGQILNMTLCPHS